MKKSFSSHRVHTIAHNAALNPQKFEFALLSPAPHIEVDLTKVSSNLVVAHTPEEYLSLSEEQKIQQDPHYIFNKIKEHNKIPFLDLKDELETISDIASIMELITATKSVMASSNNHDLLLELRNEGFTGSIFFSLGYKEALTVFLDRNRKNDFRDKRCGVSIHHTLLAKRSIVDQLKSMGLRIAAWSPNSKDEIDLAIKNGADIITSDNFQLLEEITYPDLSS